MRVRIFRLNPNHVRPFGEPDELLGEAEVPLDSRRHSPSRPYHPGYAVIRISPPSLRSATRKAFGSRSSRSTEGLKLWAFVTVIHNESQHATVISPQ